MAGYIGTKAVLLSTTAANVTGDANIGGDLAVTGTVTADGLTVDGDVGIGTSSPATDAKLHVDGTDTVVLITEDSEGEATLRFGDTQGDLSQSFAFSYDTGGADLFFRRNDSTVGRWGAEGLVAGGDNATSPYTLITANNDATKAGSGLRTTGYFAAARYQAEAMYLNRMNDDGDIVHFRKDGTTVGSIGVLSSSLHIGSGNTFLKYHTTAASVRPCTSSGLNSDNAIDLGSSSTRFDDVYATNGTIQTSDRNEKQQITDLTAAEMQAATAISKLFKTFKWNDSVAEKGDDARIHTGVIAQDVEQAMTDAGLDAGRYAFFISSTWWESTEVIPAVEEVLDEEGNVVTEAQPERTVTHTHDTAEEAPTDAVERNRKGIRYPQLLSFIGAATEQRLASIEARLDALEAN